MTRRSYANARHVLPDRLLAAVQRHFEGGMLWIPRRLGPREQYLARDEEIVRGAREGVARSALARRFGLTAERIRQIVRGARGRTGAGGKVSREDQGAN